MKNVAIIVFIALIVVTLGLYLSSFKVRETESCMVMTFGKSTRQITEPGWYFKWPAPIQRRHTFDSQIRSMSRIKNEPRRGQNPRRVREYTTSY